MNVNPAPKLTLSGRLGWMNHNFDSPPMFGDLGGLPVSEASGKQGIGTGNTVTVTGSASYLATPTFIIDTYTGGTIIKTSSLPYRIDENLGTDFLGLPGTNGGGPLYGGWPQFAVTSYSPIGAAGATARPTSTTTGSTSSPPTPPGPAAATRSSSAATSCARP